METIKKKIVILGAGLAGLAAGWKLSEAGFEVVVIDKKNHNGGLSGTVEHNGYLFDYGGHRFITNSQEIVEEIKQLMGADFWTNTRKTQYYLWHKYLNYPLELKDMVLKVNPLVSAKAMIDYLWTALKNKIKPLPEDSFEDWVVKRFGRTLYHIFFGQYTEKVWGIPPSTMDKDWASQRISLLNLWDVFKKLIIKPKNEPRTYTSTYYYCTKGIGQIANKMADVIEKNGGKVLLNSTIGTINHDDKNITSVQFFQDGQTQTISGDWILSTMPINHFVDQLAPSAPQNVKEAVSKLKFRAIIFLNILIDEELVTKNDALYIPEPKYFFFRIEQFKLWSDKMAPSGKTSLSLEISCFEDDDVWQMSDKQLYEKCLEGLKEMKLITDEKKIIEYFTAREGIVYPVFDIGYKEKIATVRDYMNKFENLIYYGRQGNFQYIHMHHVIDMGIRASKFIQGQLKQKSDITKVGTGKEYFG